MEMFHVFLALTLMLSIFLGFELIYKVPPTLHTPLMSGSNAISGITLIGALASAGTEHSTLTTVLAAGAAGLGREDDSAVIKVFQKLAGIDLPAGDPSLPET